MAAQVPLGKPSRPQKSREASGLQPELQKALGNHAEKLNCLIHERMWLGIVSALAVNESLTFTELKKLTDTNYGSLSVHACELEEAEYRVHEILRQANAADGKPPHAYQPESSRNLSGAHAGSDSGNAKEKSERVKGEKPACLN